MNKRENDFAEITFHKNYNGEKESLKKLTKIAFLKKIDEFYLIEDFKVKSSKNFGKGYGKNLFISFINEVKLPILLSPSFSDCEDYNSFSGREEFTMDNLKSAPKNLLNKFYIPVLKKLDKKFEIYNENTVIIYP